MTASSGDELADREAGYGGGRGDADGLGDGRQDPAVADPGPEQAAAAS